MTIFKDDFSDLERQDNAENLWIREIQLQSFNKEILILKNDKVISPNSRIISLSPFLDDQGLLRAQCRVKYLPDKVEKFQPLILDAKHEVTQLLIKHCHEKLFHKNHENVINELQQNYWIIGLRKILRSLVNKCSICRMLRGTAFNPKMANYHQPD